MTLLFSEEIAALNLAKYRKAQADLGKLNALNPSTIDLKFSCLIF